MKGLGLTGLAVLSGIILGAGGVLLAVAGNPENTGICVSCFLVNWAGSLGIFQEARMSYPRPELPAFVLGSFLASTLVGGFRPRASAATARLILGSAAVIVGCEVFMGCPIKLVLRLGAGDLTAAAGFAGLAAGIWLGTRLLSDGFEAPRREARWTWVSYVLPLAALALAGAAYLRTPALAFGESGPAAAHAPMAISLGFGLAAGALAQRSRFCVTGALRNFILARDRTLLFGLGTFLAATIIAALATGTFRPGYADQPGVHPDALWNFLGMFVAGLGAVAIGGCPFRQLVLGGTGDTAAALSVLTMLATAGASRTLGISSTADGPTWAGKVALLALLSLLLLPAFVAGLSRRHDDSLARKPSEE